MVEFGIRTLSEWVGTIPVLAGDPWVYMDRWIDFRTGDTPYTEMEFEHFPLVLVLIALTGVISDLTGINYWNTFAGMAAMMAVLTTFAVSRTGSLLGDDKAVPRFLILLAPLLPLVLFRTDLLPTLMAALAVPAWLAGRNGRGVLATVGGILSKGWPVVLVAIEWWRGRRLQAAALAGFCLAVVAGLVLTPGFQSGRSFSGIHQETLVGSVLLFGRHLIGFDLGIFQDAGATYVEAATWLAMLNLAIGSAIGLWALTGVRHEFTWRRALVMLSALTLALLLASPLFSPQFLVWPIAFLALVAGRKFMVLFTASSVVTILYVGFWDDTAFWWQTLLVSRNALFAFLAVVTAMAAARGDERID
jgi:hypothetical protein